MVQVTMLNSMAAADFGAALDRHVAWKLRLLDLKDRVLGRDILALSDAEAQQAASMIQQRSLEVYCLSTQIGYVDIEQGELLFRKAFEGQVERAIAIGRTLSAKVIRLLAARTSGRRQISDSMAHINSVHPWLIGFYREAIDRLAGAGFQVAMENEAHDCIWSKPSEILQFFEALDRPGRVFLTYDVQNLWQMGTFPSVDLYERLRPLIGHVHLKGGRIDAGSGSTQLKWRSALEDCDWPVVQILRRVIADGVSPVLCLNPSHGEAKSGCDYSDLVGRDLAFLRGTFPEVAR